MATTNLLDFAKTFDYNDLRNPATKNPATISPGVSNLEFEKNVIDNISNHTHWQPTPEFNLLNSFFKNRGKLENVSYFLDNISKIKDHRHGKGAELVYNYCKNVRKSRLSSDYEGIFLKNIWESHYGGRVAYKYAKYVIRNRLPVEYEKDCNDLDYLNFVESKGHDIGEILINSSSLSFYYYRQFCYLPEVAHNFMIAMQLSGDSFADSYFRQRNKDDRIIKNRLRMVDPSKTVAEVVRELK